MPFTLIVFHGSSSEGSKKAALEFYNVLKNDFGAQNFEICFLRRAPFFEDCLKALCQRGLTAIRVLPLLLLPGSHMASDIAQSIGRARLEFSNVNISLEGYLAQDKGFIGYIFERIKNK